MGTKASATKGVTHASGRQLVLSIVSSNLDIKSV